jgi:hypothetical protein
MGISTTWMTRFLAVRSVEPLSEALYMARLLFWVFGLLLFCMAMVAWTVIWYLRTSDYVPWAILKCHDPEI